MPNDPPTKSQFSTDPETVKTLQWLIDLSQKMGIMSSDAKAGTTSFFIQGRVAINVNETNNLYGISNSIAQGSIPIKWDVHPLPVMKKGRNQPINAFAYGLSKNTKNPDLAFELLKQIVGPAGQTDWYKLAKFRPASSRCSTAPTCRTRTRPRARR